MKTLILTDTKFSFNSSDFEIPGRELGFGPKGYVRKKTLHGGRQEGIEVLEISNGNLSLRICPTRGMGIIDGQFRENRIGWDSPITEIIHPAYINLLEMGGRGCHYGFNEFMNRCGTSWMGAMGTDDVVDNMGNIRSVFLPLHGKIGWIPANEVWLEWEDGILTVLGNINEQLVFGQNFVLHTKFKIERDKDVLEIEDTLINQGASQEEYEMLYHVNIGVPLLSGGSRLYATYDALMPRDHFAEKELENAFAYIPPSRGYVEKVFFLQGHPDNEGFAHNILVNKDNNIALALSYNIHSLPYTVLWKYCNDISEGYVTGINPCTDFPNPRKNERDEGRLRTIKPGESIHFNIRLGFYTGKKTIGQLIEKIEKNKGKEEVVSTYTPNNFPIF